MGTAKNIKTWKIKVCSNFYETLLLKSHLHLHCYTIEYCSVRRAGTRLSCHKFEFVSVCCTLCYSVLVMAHTWMSYVAYMNESCHASEWVMSHTSMIHITHRMRHVTEMNEPCHISHITHMHESCHTYDWVISQIWMSHVTQLTDMIQSSYTYEDMNMTCHTFGGVMWHIWGSHGTHTHVSSIWLVEMHL